MGFGGRPRDKPSQMPYFPVRCPRRGVATPPTALGSQGTRKPASNRAVLLPPKACTWVTSPLEATVGLRAICPQVQKPRHTWGCPPPTPSLRPLTKGSWVCRGRFSLACLTRAKPGDDSLQRGQDSACHACLLCSVHPCPLSTFSLEYLHTSPISVSAAAELE